MVCLLRSSRKGKCLTCATQGCSLFSGRNSGVEEEGQVEEPAQGESQPSQPPHLDSIRVASMVRSYDLSRSQRDPNTARMLLFQARESARSLGLDPDVIWPDDREAGRKADESRGV